MLRLDLHRPRHRLSHRQRLRPFQGRALGRGDEDGPRRPCGERRLAAARSSSFRSLPRGLCSLPQKKPSASPRSRSRREAQSAQETACWPASFSAFPADCPCAKPSISAWRRERPRCWDPGPSSADEKTWNVSLRSVRKTEVPTQKPESGMPRAPGAGSTPLGANDRRERERCGANTSLWHCPREPTASETIRGPRRVR